MSGLCPDLVFQWLRGHEVFDVLQGFRSNVFQCLAFEKGLVRSDYDMIEGHYPLHCIVINEFGRLVFI